MGAEINIKDIKLVISDLDGTILDSGQPLHPYTKEMILQLEDYGIHFTLASGRSLASLRPYAEALGVKIPMVLANGCIIQSLDGVIHHREFMPEDISKKVFEIANRERSDMVAFVDDRLYYSQLSDNILRVFGKIKDELIGVSTWLAMAETITKINKFMVINWESLDYLDHLEEILTRELAGQADIVRTNIHHVEVMPRGINKATGMGILAEELGIHIDQILAFGDYDNDVEMLEAAGFGAAVANASESAKGKANLVIGSCAENGPAVFLEQLFEQAG